MHHLLRKKKLTPATLIIALLIAAWYAYSPGLSQTALDQASKTQPGLYSIDHFVDGDTLAVSMNGTVEKVRMIGVDTPETHKPNSPVQCYGPAAAAYTKQTLDGKQIRLEADPENTNRDRYGRLLRYVYLPDGSLLQYKLLQEGYAFAYVQFPFSKKADFVAAQQQAQDQKKGLWANCQPFQEANGRWQTNDAGAS